MDQLVKHDDFDQDCICGKHIDRLIAPNLNTIQSRKKRDNTDRAPITEECRIYLEIAIAELRSSSLFDGLYRKANTFRNLVLLKHQTVYTNPANVAKGMSTGSSSAAAGSSNQARSLSTATSNGSTSAILTGEARIAAEAAGRPVVRHPVSNTVSLISSLKNLAVG